MRATLNLLRGIVTTVLIALLFVGAFVALDQMMADPDGQETIVEVRGALGLDGNTPETPRGGDESAVKVGIVMLILIAMAFFVL